MKNKGTEFLSFFYISVEYASHVIHEFNFFPFTIFAFWEYYIYLCRYLKALKVHPAGYYLFTIAVIILLFVWVLKN